jgi:hypothetical protein
LAKKKERKNMTIKVKLSEEQLQRLAVALEHRLRVMDTRLALKRIQRRFSASQRVRRKLARKRESSKKQ